MRTAKNQQALVVLAGLGMIFIAFLQCYAVSHDLTWFHDLDFCRDMAYVQGNLYGHFGKDPSYPGEYIWYNPLLTFIESVLVKLTGLPVNILMIRSGAYLNLLGPLSFFTMMLMLFSNRIALAGLLSFLFLASGIIPCYYAATYSPWNYPGCFTQFVFYLNLVFCYRAFTSQKYYWFVILGFCIGFGFLGHTAPTVLMILILILLQSGKIKDAVKSKDYGLIRKYILQGLAVFIPFVVASFPFLYFIVGKYHLRFLNRKPFEYVDTIFIWRNFGEMVKQNVSVSFIIAAIGFGWFYKRYHQPLIRKIILYWFMLAGIMYLYSTLVASVDEHLHIHLPGTVPSFHYFFYLKALQSVFFGFGCMFLFSKPLQWAGNYLSARFPRADAQQAANIIFVLGICICAVFYYPFYKQRFDFSFLREHSLLRGQETDKIGVYNYIMANVQADEVFLCEQETSLFPVLPTARKMVSIGITFSNPFVSFEKREGDRDSMLSFLKTGAPVEAKNIFKEYSVGYLLLANTELESYKNLSGLRMETVYRNGGYTLFHLVGSP